MAKTSAISKRSKSRSGSVKAAPKKKTSSTIVTRVSSLQQKIDRLKREFVGKNEKAPSGIQPMLATKINEPFNNADWIFEIKWDGYRCIASNVDGKVQLKSRGNMSFNTTYPPIYDGMKDW